MAEFRSQSIGGTRAIGARAALRAIPLLTWNGETDPDGEYVLSMFRAVSAGWAVAKFPTLSKRAHASEALGGASKSDLGLVRAAALAMTASAASSISTGIVKATQSGVQALTLACAQLSGHAAAETFTAALTEDLNALQRVPDTTVVKLPLWTRGEAPAWAVEKWNQLAGRLVATDLGWEVWVKWYEDRVAGVVRPDRHEFAYVEPPNELWAGAPTRVNAWIVTRFSDPKRDLSRVTPGRIDSDDSAVLEQRPSAFQFALRIKLIEAAPQEDTPSDLAFARDIHAELRSKTIDLFNRLQKTNTPRRVLQTVQRLLDCLGLGLEEVKPGVLLMRHRSMEADAIEFDTEDARSRMFPDALAMIRDVIASADDLMGAFPSIRKIQSAALALELQRTDINAIQVYLDEIRTSAMQFEIVAPSSQAALAAAVPDVEEASDAIQSATTDIKRAQGIDLRAEIVSLQVLDYRNFISAVVRPLSGFGKALRQLRAEASNVGAKSLKEAMDAIPRGVGAGVEETVKGLIKGGIAGLITSLFGPVAGLGLLIASLRPLARKVEQIDNVIGASSQSEQGDVETESTTSDKEN